MDYTTSALIVFITLIMYFSNYIILNNVLGCHMNATYHRYDYGKIVSEVTSIIFKIFIARVSEMRFHEYNIRVEIWSFECEMSREPPGVVKMEILQLIKVFL